MFLLDDVPICEQANIPTRTKLWIAMKYAFEDAKKDLSDEKAISILYQEVKITLLMKCSWFHMFSIHRWQSSSDRRRCRCRRMCS